MNDEDVKVTHTGWFLLCPIIANLEDPECPVIHERHWIFLPLYWISLFLQQCLNMIHTDENAGFYMRLKPIEEEVGDGNYDVNQEFLKRQTEGWINYEDHLQDKLNALKEYEEALFMRGGFIEWYAILGIKAEFLRTNGLPDVRKAYEFYKQQVTKKEKSDETLR